MRNSIVNLRACFALLIFSISVLAYLFISDENIARKDDYDPYRYLYNSLHGLTSEELGPNYRIVDVLSSLSHFGVGIYFAYIVISLLLLLLIYGPFDKSLFPVFPFLISLSICSFYLVQTGKDGILALTICSILSTNKSFNFGSKSSLHRLFLTILLCSLCVWIRYESIFFIFTAFMLCRKKLVILYVSTVLLALLFFLSDYPAQLFAAEAFLSESRLSETFLASYMNDNSLISYISRFAVNLISTFALPIFYLYTSLKALSFTLLTWLGLIALPIFYFLLRNRQFAYSFFLSLIPISLFISFNPILHFRYVFCFLPFALLYASSYEHRY